MKNSRFSQVVSQLVGVVDLSQGQAVHAVAGRRRDYQPVAISNGDAIELAAHYRHLGLDHLYIADLDSIAGGRCDVDTIARMIDAVKPTTLLLDIGWTGQDSVHQQQVISRLSRQPGHVCWIAASESIRSLGAIGRLADLVGPARVALGLDFHDRQLITAPGCATSEDDSLERLLDESVKSGVTATVVLDLPAVGSGDGPTTLRLCQSIRQRVPDWSIYSGGGIRHSADVTALLSSGCDRCLVATALHGIV